MKRFITTLVVIISFSLASAAFAADGVKIGSVDVQKIILTSDAGKEAVEQLAAKNNKYESEDKSRKEELNRLKAELEKQNVLLSESARSNKEKEYQQKLKEYQRFLKDAQDDMQAKNDELTSKIGDTVFKIIQDYGRKNGYTTIFARNNTMIYVDDKTDLTDVILKELNASRKK